MYNTSIYFIYIYTRTRQYYSSEKRRALQDSLRYRSYPSFFSPDPLSSRIHPHRRLLRPSHFSQPPPRHTHAHTLSVHIYIPHHPVAIRSETGKPWKILPFYSFFGVRRHDGITAPIQPVTYTYNSQITLTSIKRSIIFQKTFIIQKNELASMFYTNSIVFCK